MFKKKLSVVKAGVRGGAGEVNLEDMTITEQVAVGAGVGMGSVGVVGLAVTKAVVMPPIVVALSKGYVVAGGGLALFGVGKAFVRGFIGGIRHEMRKEISSMSREERLRKQGDLID